jgi:4-hydroxy-tetrahydrodipicolinate synthase
MADLFVASVTPFDERGAFEPGWIPLHLRWLEAQSVDGVVPCGTTGEGPSLSLGERLAVIDAALAHRGKLRVIAGTGCANLPETLIATRYALERGVEAAMIIPPFYFKNVPDAGLLAYYRAVCDELPPGGQIMLYHIPPVSQIAISTAVIDGLLESHPQAIYGLKDSGGDVEHTIMLAQRYPQIKIFNGAASLYARALAGGAAGGIFAASNIFPRELRAVMDAVANGSDPGPIQARVTALEAALKPDVIASIKALLPRMAGLPPTFPRSPLVKLDAARADAAWAKIEGLLG